MLEAPGTCILDATRAGIPAEEDPAPLPPPPPLVAAEAKAPKPKMPLLVDTNLDTSFKTEDRLLAGAAPALVSIVPPLVIGFVLSGDVSPVYTCVPEELLRGPDKVPD